MEKLGIRPIVGVGFLALLLCLRGLYAAEPPASGARQRTYPDTDLARAGRPACVVVYPAQPPVYKQLAEKVRQAIQARTGAAPDAMPDTAVTDERHPVLRSDFRDRNLILLGQAQVIK